jgi:GT2 family glycosyltransferase
VISVVIPTFERPAKLSRCLRGLAAAAAPAGGFEVVVVDDGGSTSTESIVADFRGALDLQLVRQAHAGPAAARNAGARRATRPHLAFLDDDCVPGSDWLRALEQRLGASPATAVGGRTVNALPENLYSTATQLVVDYLCAYRDRRNPQPAFFASNNLALPRDAFLEIGGFDASFLEPAGEDRDLCDRWRRSGFDMVFAPDAVVHHAHDLTLATYWRLHFTYGRGAFSYRQARARRDRGRVELEPLGFYAGLLRAPLARREPRRRFRLAAAIALAQIASASGFFWERHRSRADAAA